MVRAATSRVVVSRAAAEIRTDRGEPRSTRSAGRSSSPDEREFIQAIEAYKASSGRMFPTWSEVLEVLMDLGYVKTA
jgi:hypothetical protein